MKDSDGSFGETEQELYERRIEELFGFSRVYELEQRRKAKKAEKLHRREQEPWYRRWEV